MNQLLKMEISYSLRCENKSCKKVFVDRGKLLKHYMECKRAPCERKPKVCFITDYSQKNFTIMLSYNINIGSENLECL